MNAYLTIKDYVAHCNFWPDPLYGHEKNYLIYLSDNRLSFTTELLDTVDEFFVESIDQMCRLRDVEELQADACCLGFIDNRHVFAVRICFANPTIEALEAFVLEAFRCALKRACLHNDKHRTTGRTWESYTEQWPTIVVRAPQIAA